MRGDTRYARSGKLHIAYQVNGRGPLDLVATPGFVSHLEHQWEEPHFASYLGRLATFSRLITFDKRGTGLSDRDAGDPTLEARMDDIRAVMDAAGSKRAALLGVSEGGPMAATFAATYPERTEALILYGAFAKFSSWVPTPERLRAVEDYIDQAWGSGGILPFLSPSLAEEKSYHEWWQRYERLAASPSAALTLMRMNSEIDIRDILPSIRVPTLVIHRSDDVFINVEGGRYLAAHIPGAEYVELPGHDHPPWTGATDGVLDRIEEFLTGSRTAPEPDRVLTTIMFTDMAGSTRTALRLGDRHWRGLLETYQSAVKREIATHRGRMIKTMWDGVLATFDGPARAVRCGLALHSAAAGIGVEVRIGLHTGEVELMEDDVGGIAVHISARIGSLAQAGEVLVSSTVRDLVAGSGLRFRDRGVTNLKGLDEPFRLLVAEPEVSARANA